MKKNNKKGFTLLEVLVSIIIVGIVLTCVVILTNASTEASSKSNIALPFLSIPVTTIFPLR